MQICAKKSAHTAATVRTQKHSDYNYVTTSARTRQARKKSTDRHIRAALTAIGFALLIAAASADGADLLSGRATLFVAVVGVLAMWTGGASNA